MAELFSKLGIDWRLLIANTITFFVVLWVLRKFAYRPIMNVLEQRQHTVNAGLDAAQRSTTELAAIQQEKAEILKAAKREAQTIVRSAQQQGAAAKAALLAEAQTEAAAALAKTKAQLAREKESMIAAAKTELADVVVQATAKVLDAKLDTKMKQSLSKEAITALKEVRR